MARMRPPSVFVNNDGPVTSAYLQRNFKDVRQMALKKPVEITVYGKNELMLITREKFEELVRQGISKA